MKLKIVLMLITLTLLSVMPMIYMGTFNPMAFFASGLNEGASQFSRLKDSVPENLPNVITKEKVQVYKWRDVNGVMQFSHTPPADGARAEQIEINPNHNLMKAAKVPIKTTQEQETTRVENPGPYSLKGMKKTMDDAKNIEPLLQKSHEERQKLINNL